MNIEIKKINKSDIRTIWEKGFSEKMPEWKKWDGPYFDDYKYIEFDEFIKTQSSFFLSENIRGIYLDDKILGMLSKFWIDKKTRWLEIGITIYKSDKWSLGIGSKALRLWISEIFDTTDNLEHIGLTTWSGNQRMIRTAEKIGMKEEARIRKVRWHNNVFYDSVKYGILRDEYKQK